MRNDKARDKGGESPSKKPKVDESQKIPESANKSEKGPNVGQQSALAKLMAAAQKLNFSQKTNPTLEGKPSEKMKWSQAVEDSEESEDEGFKIGDMIQPGSDKLNIEPVKMAPDFTENDRKIYVMQYSADHSVAINEYGSNMFKSKFDPLTTLQAKSSIMASKTGDGKNDETMVTELKSRKARTQW